jgi:hypothetical protein
MPEANEWTRSEQRIMREMRIKFNGEANGKLTEILRRERERVKCGEVAHEAELSWDGSFPFVNAGLITDSPYWSVVSGFDVACRLIDKV